MMDLNEICVSDRCYRFASVIERWPIEPGRIVRLAFCANHATPLHTHTWTLAGYDYPDDPHHPIPIATCHCGEQRRWEA